MGVEGERRLLLGMGRATRDDLLFPRWDGQIRSPHWLTQKFQQAMAALKIKGVPLHSLRHTHASQLIASGMDVLTISCRLGHASPCYHLDSVWLPDRRQRSTSSRGHGT